MIVTKQTENRYFSSLAHFFRGKGQGEKEEKTEGEEIDCKREKEKKISEVGFIST